jgi:hypothetical protein
MVKLAIFVIDMIKLDAWLVFMTVDDYVDATVAQKRPHLLNV